MKSIFFTEIKVPYNLRSSNPFKTTNAKSVFNDTVTIAFRGPKIWAIVPENIRKSDSIIEFQDVPTGYTKYS